MVSNYRRINGDWKLLLSLIKISIFLLKFNQFKIINVIFILNKEINRYKFINYLFRNENNSYYIILIIFKWLDNKNMYKPFGRH